MPGLRKCNLAISSFPVRSLRKTTAGHVCISFYLLFVVGGGWALLAHCGLVDAPAPLDWLTMFAVFLLVGCFWQVGRRGLLVRGPR